ncbi:DarT ssDNA thymidine ADP-ribosyltransferase family protein [Neptunomonas japonica]|uniref:DarT ssDNA thymidine ADP-ribosyltransferase family protein n=1 Tax=Neptunomonas japonica TaxID=417574 RepID=UPI000408F7BC|nr:DarT ssDNA thymidine ADP-ribosyltransferase family protein [Neptunomonas japonica]
MTISEVVSSRNIKEVVHFSTNKGLIGILATRHLKARNLLNNDQYLEFILKKNSKYRSDPNWVNYISLSITKMNTIFFSYCSEWHDDIKWCAICFSPSILEDEGVIFTTTNNIYKSSVKRAEGSEGLSAMFGSPIRSRYTSVIDRSRSDPENMPTDIQAEVLYPEQISIDYIERIIVRTDDDADDICGITSSFGHSHIQVEVDPTFFK